MILRVVFSGIMTFVAQPNWENPDKVWVLFNSGMGHEVCDPTTAAAAHAVPHHALLFVDPDNVVESRIDGPKVPPAATTPGPLIARLQERNCLDDHKPVLHPMRELWALDGFSFELDAGTAPKLETVTCEVFDEPGEKCESETKSSAVAGRSQANDIRWVLDLNELAATPDAPLVVEPACLATPAGEACHQRLAARMEISSGLLFTDRLVGTGSSAGLAFKFSDPFPGRRGGTPRSMSRTFAGPVILELQTDTPEVILKGRCLRATGEHPCKLGNETLTLKLQPSYRQEVVTVTVENVPLHQLLMANPCLGARSWNPVEHARLMYDFVQGCKDLRSRPVPQEIDLALAAVDPGRDPDPPSCEPKGRLVVGASGN